MIGPEAAVTVGPSSHGTGAHNCSQQSPWISFLYWGES